MFLRLRKPLSFILKNTPSRLVLFLTVAVFFIILAVSLTSYYTSKTVLQSELGEPQYQMLQISMNYIDQYIKESNQIAIQVALNSNVYEFLTAENQNSYDNITAIYDLLTTLITNTPYINSIYIHDLRQGSFVSIPQGYSSSQVTFPDGEWVGIAEEFGSRKMLVRKRAVPDGAGRRGSEITLFRKVDVHGEFRAIIAINLRQDELFSKLHPPQRSRLERSRFIVDSEGNVLYFTGSGAFGTEALLQTIAEFPEGEAGTIRYGGRSYLVNQLESPVTGWKYISVVSQDSLLEKSKQVRDAVLLVSIAAIVLGAVVIFYIHWIAFRPVRRIQQLFRAEGRENVRSDLRHLERLTEELLAHHAQLSQRMRQTLSDGSSKFLFDLCIGNIASKREIQEKWKLYFQDWSDAPLSIALVSIDRYGAWTRRFPDADHSLLKFALANMTAELLAPHWRTVCADFGKDQLVILMQPIGPALQEGRIREKGEEVIGTAERLLGFSVSIGISEAQEGVSGLRQAMLEADNALSYRLFRGYGSLIFFSEVQHHEMPASAEKELAVEGIAEAVQAGDAERAKEMLRSLMQDIREHRWYPSKALSVLRALEERLQQMEGGEEPELWLAADGLDEWSTLDLDDIASALLEQIAALSERYRRLVQSKEFVLCQKMIDYMKSHLEDAVGIEQIAEAAGISVSLASQLFKQEMKDTIYGYFTKLRMDRAGELLIETDDKISDIAGKVGYQHENSFIRVFRKYKEMTPGKYREMMKIRKNAGGNGIFPA